MKSNERRVAPGADFRRQSGLAEFLTGPGHFWNGGMPEWLSGGGRRVSAGAVDDGIAVGGRPVRPGKRAGEDSHRSPGQSDGDYGVGASQDTGMRGRARSRRRKSHAVALLQVWSDEMGNPVTARQLWRVVPGTRFQRR